MAQIPVYQQDIQQGAGGLQQGIDPGVASLQSEAISRFGADAMKVASALYAREDAESRERNKIILMNVENGLRAAADDALDKTLVNGEPGGKNWMQIAESEYDKVYSKYTKGITDAATMEKIQAVSGQVSNSLREKVYAAKSKEFMEFTKRNYQQNTADKAAIVRKDPSAFERESALLEEILSTSSMANSVKPLAIQEGRKELARAAIQAYKIAAAASGNNPMTEELWDRASNDVLTRFAGVFTQEEADKELDGIRTDRSTTAEMYNREASRVEKWAKIELARQQDKVVRSRFEEMSRIQKLPPEKRAGELQRFKETLSGDVALKRMEETDMNHLLSAATRVQSNAQQKNILPFYDKLARSKKEDLAGLRQEVMRAAAIDFIDPASADTLLNHIMTEEKRRGERRSKDPRIANAEDILNAAVGYDPTRGFLKGDYTTLLVYMKDEFLKNIENGIGLKDPVSMATRIADKYKPGEIRSKAYHKAVGTDDPVSEMKKIRANKKMDPKEALDVLKILDRRMERKIQREKEKQGGK